MTTIEALPPLDKLRRYPVNEALAYLATSRASLYKLIATDQIKTIKQPGRRGRRFIPGSEIARLCAVPASSCDSKTEAA